MSSKPKTTISFNVSKQRHKQLSKMADQELRTLANLVEYLFEKHIGPALDAPTGSETPTQPDAQ